MYKSCLHNQALLCTLLYRKTSLNSLTATASSLAASSHSPTWVSPGVTVWSHWSQWQNFLWHIQENYIFFPAIPWVMCAPGLSFPFLFQQLIFTFIALYLTQQILHPVADKLFLSNSSSFPSYQGASIHVSLTHSPVFPFSRCITQNVISQPSGNLLLPTFHSSYS